MIKFGELLEQDMAKFKVNPVTQAFGVIIILDKLTEKYIGNSYFVVINGKEYELKDNRFDNNIKDVTLDTNKISEEQLKDAEIKILK